MRLIIVISSLLALSSLGMQPANFAPQDEIHWLSIDQAYERAQTDGKKILIDFYTDWCGWCKRLDRDTYSQAEVAAYINTHFHPVKFDAEQRQQLTLAGRTYKFLNKGRRGVHEFAAVMMNGRLSYPSTAILQADLRPVTVVPGYHGPEEMLMILTFLGEDHYQQTSWEAFQRQYQSE